MWKKENKFKRGKRKRSTCEDNMSGKIINCIKTYQKILNNKILKQRSYYSDGIKDLPGNGKKHWFKELMQYIKTSLSNLKFVLVPFFSVFEKDVEIDLWLSEFAQMYTYILYCPDIAQCPWLQRMIPTNNTNCNFLMHKIPSNVECLVLLHSSIIINFEKLGTINKEVNNDEMDDGPFKK